MTFTHFLPNSEDELAGLNVNMKYISAIKIINLLYLSYYESICCLRSPNIN